MTCQGFQTLKTERMELKKSFFCSLGTSLYNDQQCYGSKLPNIVFWIIQKKSTFGMRFSTTAKLIQYDGFFFVFFFKWILVLCMLKWDHQINKSYNNDTNKEIII